MKNSKEMVEKWKGLKVDLLLRLVQPFNLSTFQLFLTLKLLIVSLLCIMTISSCYENRNGCLDLRATNFDIDADRECDDCCVYPQLKLVFEHKLIPDSATNLTYNTAVYRDGAGNAFRVRNIQFYVSNAYLILADGTVVAPTDSLLVSVQPPDGEARRQNVSDNVAIINRSNFAAAEMGRLVTEGQFSKLVFTVGLPEILNQVIPSSLPDSLVNHPLENTTMFVNQDTGFIFNRLQLFNNPEPTDTIFTTYRVFAPHSATIELPLPNANVIEGFHVRVIVRINYLEWFKNVDLKNDTPATVATKITQNLSNAFSVTRVEMEGL